MNDLRGYDTIRAQGHSRAVPRQEHQVTTSTGHTYEGYCPRVHTKLHFPDPKIELKQFRRDDLLNEPWPAN